jgi:hypothetical protein
MKKFSFAVSLLVFLFLAAAETWANPLTYTIDYRNPNISIPEERKQAVINQVLKNWPNSKIKVSWDDVYNSAIKKGWNPAFVIALWIEESGASGVDAYDLGCLGGNRNDIASQLDCLFKRPYANQPFRTFMCIYSGEQQSCYTNPNYNFSNNPYFPTNLGIWYQRLAGNAGLGGSVGDRKNNFLKRQPCLKRSPPRLSLSSRRKLPHSRPSSPCFFSRLKSSGR